MHLQYFFNNFLAALVKNLMTSQMTKEGYSDAGMMFDKISVISKALSELIFSGGFFTVKGPEFQLKQAGESFVSRRKFFENEAGEFTSNSYTFIGKL